jgi:class 3 adenylate cyclase
LPVYIGVLIARRIAAQVKRYDQLAGGTHIPTIMPGKVRFASGGHARLMRLRDQLQHDGAPPDLLNRLVNVLEQADELAVAQLRPYALADEWQVPRRAVLELFLRATSAGLLDFQWELLCPLCRNGSNRSDSLSSIDPEVHCDSCNINYTVNFDRSVELTFRPNPAIRPATRDEFCVGAPARTPHIVSQQVVPPDETRTLTLSLEMGRYRLRTLHYPGGQHLQVQPGGRPAFTCYPDPREVSEGEPHIAPVATLHMVNNTTTEQVFILERMAWSDQAATAAEVTALQLFRSLFSSEALRPGERISVGSITIVFTDLRGSTRLYREIGDAPAFGRVMNHFDVLRDAVDREGGALVKTIGDAVMAVFHRPVAALRAMLYAQHVLAHPPAEDITPMYLKAGIHTGACIAVNLNERLDYFGSTINMAARLEGVSSGQDIIITQEVHADPEVDALLAENQEHFRAESFTRTLKGFDTEEFYLWRIISLADDLAFLQEFDWPVNTTRYETVHIEQ